MQWKNYYETKTTRDREIVQPGLLQMLNWNILRIWSVDWFTNKVRVLNQIMEELERIKKMPRQNITTCKTGNKKDMEKNNTTPLKGNTSSDKPQILEPLIAVKPLNARELKYCYAEIPQIEVETDINLVISCESIVKSQLQLLIKVEQPINNTLIYKRIAQIWKITRGPARLQTMLNNQLDEFYNEVQTD